MQDKDAEPVILAENLSRRYGRVAAVADVSLSVRRGEVLALLGPNGAGKTTTLSMLTGNLAIGGGRVALAGHDLLEAPREARRSLGYLPEHPPVYPELTIREYLAFCARLHRLPRPAVKKAVAEALERCGLGGMGGRLIGRLSKGYRQRVGLAQAVVHRPRALILDEPSVGLDPAQVRATRRLIRELASDAAVIVSTHLLAEAAEVADRVAILSHGRIVHQSAPRDGALRLRLELENPPPRERVAALPGVARAETPRPGLFLLTVSPEADPRRALLEAALAGDWGLKALAPERASLEETFMAAVTDAPGAAA